MPPSRQSRGIASPGARDFNETSAGPSDAPHVRRQAMRESRGALCHKFHSHPPLAVGATKKSAAPICWRGLVKAVLIKAEGTSDCANRFGHHLATDHY